MSHSSRKAVLTAIVSNSIVTVIKFIAATFSGSASMMNESVHSLMDTLNQGFLLLGLREANRPADKTYAFGHGQKNICGICGAPSVCFPSVPASASRMPGIHGKNSDRQRLQLQSSFLISASIHCG
jgi:hypothetical protein